LRPVKTDRHVIEIAKARILVEKRRAKVLTKPKIKSCPVHAFLSGAEEVSVANVRHAAESMIRDEGMFTARRNADLIWGCASRTLIQLAGESALVQIGIQIPVFAMTDRGKELILSRVRDLGDQLLIGREKLPKIVRGLHPKPLS